MHIQGTTVWSTEVPLQQTFKVQTRYKLWNSQQRRSVSVLHNDLTVKQSIINRWIFNECVKTRLHDRLKPARRVNGPQIVVAGCDSWPRQVRSTAIMHGVGKSTTSRDVAKCLPDRTVWALVVRLSIVTVLLSIRLLLVAGVKQTSLSLSSHSDYWRTLVD